MASSDSGSFDCAAAALRAAAPPLKMTGLREANENLAQADANVHAKAKQRESSPNAVSPPRLLSQELMPDVQGELLQPGRNRAVAGLTECGVRTIAPGTLVVRFPSRS